MADRIVNPDSGGTPSNFQSVYNAATHGDRLILLPGTHTWTTQMQIAKRITIEGSGFQVGEMVTGSARHTHAACPVRINGRLWFRSGAGAVSSGAQSGGCIFRGISVDAKNAPTARSGAILVDTGSAMTLEDFRLECRGTSGNIGLHIGGGVYTAGVIVRRARFRDVGGTEEYPQEHDHPIYAKLCTGILVEDCLFYENRGWAFHMYYNCDNGLWRRCIIDRCNAGVTFSGESGLGNSDNNVVEQCIITNAQRAGRFLLESYLPGNGNVVRNCNVWQGSGAGGRLGSLGGVSLINLSNQNPLYTNPTAGDYTLASNSPSIGYGPTYSQPGGAPPQQHVNVSNFAAAAGDTQVTLTWTNPPSALTGAIFKIVRSTTGFILDPTGQTSVFQSTWPFATQWIDTGRTNGVTYYYTGWVVGPGAANSSPVTAAATPSAGTPPPPPPPGDPFPGKVVIGATTLGSAWRGMTADRKRGWRFPFPPGRQVPNLAIHLRGTGSVATALTPLKMMVYNEDTGALLGTSNERQLAETITPAWYVFSFPAAVVTPPMGGNVGFWIIKGPPIGDPGTGEVQFLASIEPSSLRVNDDLYSDGPSNPIGSLALTDQYLAGVAAEVEAAPVAPSATELQVTFDAAAELIAEPTNSGSIPTTDQVLRVYEESTCPGCGGLGIRDYGPAYRFVGGVRAERVEWQVGVGWVVIQPAT